MADSGRSRRRTPRLQQSRTPTGSAGTIGTPRIPSPVVATAAHRKTVRATQRNPAGVDRASVPLPGGSIAMGVGRAGGAPRAASGSAGDRSAVSRPGGNGPPDVDKVGTWWAAGASERRWGRRPETALGSQRVYVVGCDVASATSQFRIAMAPTKTRATVNPVLDPGGRQNRINSVKLSPRLPTRVLPLDLARTPETGV